MDNDIDIEQGFDLFPPLQDNEVDNVSTEIDS
jgi:hypothetical protein